MYPERLFIEALRECSPTEASLYERGLVDRYWLLQGKSASGNTGHLDFGATEAAIWIGPIIGTTLMWLFDIGQEALRDRIKEALARVLKAKVRNDSTNSPGIPGDVLFDVRAKFNEECRKRGIDDQTTLRCSDAFVSILIANSALLAPRATK